MEKDTGAHLHPDRGSDETFAELDVDQFFDPWLMLEYNNSPEYELGFLTFARLETGD